MLVLTRTRLVRRGVAGAPVLLALLTACTSDDVSVTEDDGDTTSATAAPATSTSPDDTTSTTDAQTRGSSESSEADSSSTGGFNPTTMSTTGDPMTGSSSSSSSSSGPGTESDTDPSSSSSSSSSSGGPVQTDCPYGALNVPDNVAANTVDEDSEFSSSCGGGGAPDVSYTFTAPFGGLFVFDTFGSSIDTVLSARAGTCGGAEIACNDNFGASPQSQISIPLLMGDMATIVVDGFSVVGGPIDLNVAGFEGACPDEDLGNTAPQTQSGTTALGDNTLFASCGGNQAADDAYTFTAPSAGIYTIDTTGSDFDTVLAIFDSCGGTELVCNDDFGGATSRVDVALAADEQILILVDGAGTDEGNYDLNIALDACPDFDLGSIVPQTVSGSTIGSIDANPQECATSNAPDVSYTFTAPSDGTFVFDTFGSAFDTVLVVYDGAVCDGDTLLGCNDQTNGNQSQVAVDLVADQTVTVVVDGYSTASGSFDLNVSSPECGNDVADLFEDCDGADLGGETCTSQGLAGGTLACEAGCNFDYAGCTSCGDNIANGADTCDGTALAMTRCEDLGFAGGSLDCNGDCGGFDTAECSNNVVALCSSPDLFFDEVISAVDTIVVPDMGAIADVDVWVDVTHVWDDDVELTLSADTLGLSNNLSHGQCGSLDDFWAFFNDEADTDVGTACDAPIGVEGNLRPEQPMSVYDGSVAAGSWTLTAADTLVAFDGNLNSWCIYITLE